MSDIEEFEVAVKRQRQIDIGKNSLSYGNYIQSVPRNERISLLHPQTPNKYQKCSSRSWDGQVKRWKSLLHQWDPPNRAKIIQTVHFTPSGAVELANEQQQTIRFDDLLDPLRN